MNPFLTSPPPEGNIIVVFINGITPFPARVLSYFELPAGNVRVKRADGAEFVTPFVNCTLP